jgi:hypothetical protein
LPGVLRRVCACGPRAAEASDHWLPQQPIIQRVVLGNRRFPRSLKGGRIYRGAQRRHRIPLGGRRARPAASIGCLPGGTRGNGDLCGWRQRARARGGDGDGQDSHCVHKRDGSRQSRYRLPAIYGFREFALDGGLMSYEHLERLPPGWKLYCANSQRRKAGGSAHPAADKIRAAAQSQNRQGVGA